MIALQETHLTQHQEYAFSLFAQSYECFFSHSSMQSAGVFLAIHRNQGFKVEHYLAIDSHIQVLDIRYNDLPLRIINVYAPTNAEKQKKAFQQLSTLVIKDSTIILRDFNSVQPQSDRLSNQTNATTNTLNQLLNDFQLKESKYNGAFTYQNSGDASKQSRINYIFGPVEIMNNTYLYQVWTSISDHSILVVREDHGVE